MVSISRFIATFALLLTMFGGASALADSCSATKTCYKMLPGQCSVSSPSNGWTVCYNTSQAVCIAYDANGQMIAYETDSCNCYSETFCEAFPWRCAPECL